MAVAFWQGVEGWLGGQHSPDEGGNGYNREITRQDEDRQGQAEDSQGLKKGSAE